jgi:hypothetical protein
MKASEEISKKIRNTVKENIKRITGRLLLF